MESIGMIALRIACIISFIKWANCLSPRNKDYNGTYYNGHRIRAVVVVTIGLYRQPLCYGVLVWWNKAVVPCSCVTVPADPKKAGTAWYHPDMPGETIFEPDKSKLRVGLMAEEHRAPVRLLLGVEDVKKHPKCDSLYTVNIAVLTMKLNADKMRLAWVNSASSTVLNFQIHQAAESTASYGECRVVRWLSDPKVSFRVGRYHNLVTHVGWPNWVHRSDKVKIAHWGFCRANVCPTLRLKNVTTIKHRKEYCFNRLNQTRWCVRWYGKKQRLCDLLQGTPVFCNVPHRVGGVVGLLYSKTTFCEDPSKAIMVGIDNALELMGDDLPLTRLKNYKKIEKIQIAKVNRILRRKKKRKRG